MILNDYLQSTDDYFLEVFLNNGNIESCLPYLEQIWLNHPSNFLKQKIIKHLCRDHIECFEFLRALDPEKYLFAISISNSYIEEKGLVTLYDHISQDLKPFALLSIGRMNKWEFIEQETLALIG